VRGAGSYGQSLVWFADRSTGALPTPGVFWLPMWTWRLAMLLWSLWLASRLLKWMRWGWEQFSADGLWTMPPWWKWGGPTTSAKPGVVYPDDPPTDDDAFDEAETISEPPNA